MNRTLYFTLVAAAMILAACGGNVAIGDLEKVAANAAATAVAEYAAANPPAVDPTATAAPEETQTAEETKEAATEAAPPASPNQGEFINTLGYGSEMLLKDPGVLTGEPGDQVCKDNPSCWWVNPDNQVKLTLDGQTVNLDEGAFLMCSFGGGTFAIGDVLTMKFDFVEFHQWFLIIRGNAVGEGDRNLPVTVTGIAEGFVLCTNLPPGMFVSEGYVLQNVQYGYAHECGEWDHCTNSTLGLLDVNDLGNQVMLYQSAPSADWQKGAGGKFAVSN